MAVLSSGLHEATNLLSRFGSIAQLRDACDGWWLATVLKVIREDGREEEPADFATRAVERRGLESLGKGRKKKKTKEEGEKDAGSSAKPASQRAEAADAPPGADSANSSLPITKVRLLWMGLENSRTGEGHVPVCCKASKPMRSLEIEDVISRCHIVYEEEDLHHIRFKVNDALHKNSIERIIKALPKVMPSAEEEEDGVDKDGEVVKVAPRQGYNHAGVYIGANDLSLPSRDEDQRGREEATAEEVCGYQWSADPEPEEPDPPTFTVVGLRRGGGQVYCVVQTSHGDQQQDHTLEAVRRRIYYSVMDDVKVQLPFMMQWPRFRWSTLILDPTIIRANALHYEKVIR